MAHTFFAGGGQCGELVRAYHWASTSIGPITSWPQSLRTTVGTVLLSRVPMVLLWGEDGIMIYNDAYSVFAGDRHPGLLGSKVREGWPEVADFNDNVMRVGLSGRTLAYKDKELTLFRYGRAEQVWMDLDYSPVLDEAEQPAGVLCVLAETTERVAADRNLKRGEARLASIFAGATVGLSEVGLDGRFLRVNQELCRILGRTPDEMLRLSIAEVTHPEDVIRSREAVERATRTGGTASLDKRYRRPDGAIVWANSRVTRLHEIEGEPGNLLVVTVDLTERYAAEERLRASEEFNRRILASSADCIKVIGLDGRLEFMSEGGMCVMEVEDFGLIRGARWPEFWRAEERAKAEAAIEEAKHGGTGRFHGLAATLKGAPRWWDVIVTSINGPDGCPERLLSVSRDVTATKQAEQHVRESEARFRLMADSVPQIVWITDAEGRAEFFNKQWADYTGVPYEPTTAAEVAATHVHPDDAQHTMTAFEEAQRSGSTFRVEHRIRSASGSYRWFLVRAEPYRDPGTGEIVRWFGASVDIHDRKQAEEALLALNADLEQQVIERSRERGLIWQHSLDLLSVIDMGTATFDAVNPAWTAALGWSTVEIERRPYSAFVHPEDVAASGAAFAQIRQGNPVLHFENRYRTKGGGWRWLSWAAVSEGGKLYSITRDITEEKARRAELEAAQEALRQSQKMEAMGQLTGGVAHDFNNLLTPIVGSLDMLQRKGLGGEREQRLIAGAMQSAERAKTLVQRLLAFARRQPLQSVPVDVAKLVRGMGDLVSSTTGPQIKVVVETPDELPPAKADPNQLEMALLNLSVNARDAMLDGGTLRISVSQERVGAGHQSKLRPGSYIRLSVADTGAGMDEATLARAVEPFFSTKGVGKGTGLGLSMVHGLASQLSGALTIQSCPGLGTNVELWLPQSTAAPDEAEVAAGPAAAPLKRGTALLVDDEELVRMSTADMLSELGYAVIEAASGEEALRLVHAGERFDLLVTDHLMPGITGTDLAHAVRVSRPAMPVLLVSGYAESDGVAADLPRLTKPFRKDELATSLAQLPNA